MRRPDDLLPRRPAGRLLVIAAALLAAGCANLAPRYERPASPLPAAWPAADAVGATAAPADAQADAQADAADLGWREFIVEPRLREAVAIGLAHNRDLRIATLNVERARAQYRVVDAQRLPEAGLGAAASRTRSAAAASDSGVGSTRSSFDVELGLAAWEIDFFGRVRNLGESALQGFFAVEENRRAAQISLVAEIASAWLTLAADQQRLALARRTLESQRASLELTRRIRELGATSGLALAQAQTTVDAARVEVARYTTLVAQDRQALELLAGTPLPDTALPAPPSDTATPEETMAASRLVEVPAGLPSEVLQRRPDVRAAERQLQAAAADIGVARAALFPSLSLTAAAGTQSRSLSGLFGAGSGTWSFAPRLDLPIFDAGARRAGVAVSQADQRIGVATYERTLQTAFREVADALADRATLAERLDAQRSRAEATQRSLALSQERFRRGASGYLEVLDAQRSLYAAQQDVITLRLAEQANRLALYRALGGGWTAGDGTTLTPGP